MQQPEYSPSIAQQVAARLEATTTSEVRFDDGSRALYATDASLYRQVPIGVVVPKSFHDVEQTIAVCREFDVPVLARGAGTSLAGQCCNVAVIIDFSKHLHHINGIDVSRRRAKVETGCVLDNLRNVAERDNLTFAPDPSTHGHNTLGGMIGNNSCGVHSVMGGRTADNVHSMDILTYDGLRMRVGPTSEEELERVIAEGGRRGEIYAGLRRIRDRYGDLIRQRFPQIPRRVSGYNLDELLPERGFNVARALVGSEGTCVTVLCAELELRHSPPCRALLILGYEDAYTCADHVPEILEAGPTGLEGIDRILIESMEAQHMHDEERKQLPPGRSWLLVEFGGETLDEAEQKANTLVERLRQHEDAPSCRVFTSKQMQHKIWKVREAGLGATSRAPQIGTTHPGWEDAAVPPAKLGSYLREFRDLMHKHGYEAALYGHFGDGCIHCRINFDLGSERGVERWRQFMNEAADLVVSYGGSLSGEHGDGQVRAELLPRMFGPELMEAFREFKSLWDPRGRMNPGKVVDPYPMDDYLRRGPETTLPQPKHAFDYSNDNHSFDRAVDRCVGIGACRDFDQGVMCPSYRATLEEKHSTRGRARLLYEMLKGDVLVDGWKSEAVRDSLDLCLSCKGCKRDCPVGVDMATLKAEFMFHHFKGRLRPVTAYSMGMIWWWSRLAVRVPRLANFFLQTPYLSGALKRLGGIAPQREFPRYAESTFTDWFSKREVHNEGKPQVVLWPDTFNNHFFPETLQAITRVLEDAGFQVQIPGKVTCCALPLYAEGMLTQARKQLSDLLDSLQYAFANRLPVVGLEPACVASFRDELKELLPNDDRAHYLSENTFLFSEFLVRQNYQPPQVKRRALVHIHCHHHASLDVEDECELMKKMKLDYQLTPSTCCGMAGSFGFKRDNYEVSQEIAEHKLIPVVKEQDPDTLIVTNGFSCREQITQCTGRSTMTLPELMDMGLKQGKGLRLIKSG
ncbi:FAD-binding oxidoreductase [Proteobacteria bacterium 005FR1]|nr:FAD-binding oxidoreductase [Proteobacteria bacterium 005FR1]